MAGTGPFLWLDATGPPSGFRTLPPAGMCVSVFLFVEREGRILLGRYADDPRWEALTGLDEPRWRLHGKGLTIPATHLKLAEPPRAAAERIARDVLRLPPLAIEEAGVESEHYIPTRLPERGEHYDLWLFYRARVDGDVPNPPWYAALGFHDPRALRPDAYARGHEDVVSRWLTRAERAGPTPRA